MRKFAVAVALAAATAVGAIANGIEADALRNHIAFLASDDLRGRANGTAELERAADYVAAQFAAAGLKAAGSNGTWFQTFELVAGLSVGENNRLSIDYKGQTLAFDLGVAFYPMAVSPSETLSTPSADLERVPVVFAGYGLSLSGMGYDDYGRVDVRGKAVLIFSHEPQERDPRSRLNGARPMPQTTLAAKAAAARRKGARALLVVSDPSHAIDDARYETFPVDPDASDHAIPVLRVRRTEMQPLLDAWRLDAAARVIDTDLTPRSAPLTGAFLTYREHLARNRRMVRNIVGILPGSDPARAREAIVIGAHYDHVGLGGRLSVSPERTGEIHNGADDNASGTAAIIEIARAAVSQRARFARTLVFVAFAGEERGLLGSEYYATAPPVPVHDTVAMLNLDMVGRSRGAVDISGLETSPSIETDLQAAVAATQDGLTVRREGPGAGRSDDASFIAVKVPAINFFTGFHSDYHRPTDDSEKIDLAGTRRVATLALELAARLASRVDRPEFVEPR